MSGSPRLHTLAKNPAKSDALQESIQIRINGDFSKVSESIEEFVFNTLRPRIKDPSDKFKQVRTHLYDRYEDKIKASNTEYTQLLYKLYLNVLAKRKEDARRGKL